MKMEVSNHAFTQLPVEEKADRNVDYDNEPVKKKLIVIPTSTSQDKEGLETASPLYKIKNILDKYKDMANMTESGINKLLNDNKDTKDKDKDKEKKEKPEVIKEEPDKDTMLDLIPIYHKKSETQMELK